MSGSLENELVAHAIQKIDGIGEETLSKAGMTYGDALIGSQLGSIDLDTIEFAGDNATAGDFLDDADAAAELGYANASDDGSAPVLMYLIQPDEAAELALSDPGEGVDGEYLV